MKVTRLKRGYRIRLSDAEYELVKAACDFGEADLEEGGDKSLSPAAKAAWSRRGMPAIIRIDEDRRG